MYLFEDTNNDILLIFLFQDFYNLFLCARNLIGNLPYLGDCKNLFQAIFHWIFSNHPYIHQGKHLFGNNEIQLIDTMVREFVHNKKSFLEVCIKDSINKILLTRFNNELAINLVLSIICNLWDIFFVAFFSILINSCNFFSCYWKGYVTFSRFS